jgi:hypothetical protein
MREYETFHPVTGAAVAMWCDVRRVDERPAGPADFVEVDVVRAVVCDDDGQDVPTEVEEWMIDYVRRVEGDG